MGEKEKDRILPKCLDGWRYIYMYVCVKHLFIVSVSLENSITTHFYEYVEYSKIFIKCNCVLWTFTLVSISRTLGAYLSFSEVETPSVYNLPDLPLAGLPSLMGHHATTQI